jgi:hypothetical protein
MGKELYYLDKHGKKQDSALHAEILNNVEAKYAIAKTAIMRAVKDGMHPKVATRLYQYYGKIKPHLEESRADVWWDKLTRDEQLIYLKAHPKSIYRNKVKFPGEQLNLPNWQKLAPIDKPVKDPVAHLKSRHIEAKISKYINSYSKESHIKAWQNILRDIDPEKLASSMLGNDKYTILKISTELDDGENFSDKNTTLQLKTDNFNADRTFIKEDDGLHVYHAYFKISDDFQGKNIAKDFLKHSMATYQTLGVKDIKLHANIDVGGYAWAKYGFVPEPNDWKKLKLRMLKRLTYMKDNKFLIDDETMNHVEQMLLSEDPATIRKIADLTIPVKILPIGPDTEYPEYSFQKFIEINADKTMSLGKALLLNDDWHGKFDLNNKESMNRFNAYVNQ